MKQMKPLLSHSEIDKFLQCERAHYYQHGEKLVPRKRSDALHRGIEGHEILQQGVRVFKETGRYNDFVQACINALSDYVAEDPDTATQLLDLIVGFLENPETRELLQTAKVAFVEEKMYLEFSNFWYAFTADVGFVVDNRLEIWDWKFIYDPYQSDVIGLLPQLLRYSGAARALGWNVHRARYAMIRTRKVKDAPKYFIKPVELHPERIKNAFGDLTKTATRILPLKELPLDQWKAKVVRTANVMNCKNCPFKSICLIEFSGEDADLTRRMSYEENTRYGYEHPESTGVTGGS